MGIRLAFVAAVLAAFVTGTPATASIWTIPGTVNAGGLNNTRFISDLAVTNPGSVPVQATISFVPPNGTTPRQVTLTAGQTVVYRNVLDSLWGAQGAGATQVASDSPLLIRARTYNTAASGTYGVALPVFADERMLSSGTSADSLWISQAADGSSGFRTNIAVVFPDPTGGEARVTVYDADGNQVGSKSFSLGTAGFQQFGVGSFAGSVAIARAEIQVIRGPAAAYSVVVDNVTGDSSLFTFEDLPAGWQDVLVNGVARANGRNNAFFRTDGRFYNPTSEDANVTVAFHNNQNANPAPLTRTFTVPAGKIRDVVDVLDSLLGIPVGSAGALRFTSDAPVAISCRTSNVDPLGVKPGTFGAQQRPAQLLSFLMSADAGAVVTGIRQNAAFRTNVGFAAGPDGAAYSLALRNAAGATVATATGSLGAFGWTQPNVQDLFPSTPIPDDATLLVKVSSGSVDVFDSSIDNASGDPVVTPIMPLPVDIPSAATIGPLGGSIRSSDGGLTLKVPAGALGAPTPISIAIASSGASDASGPGYEVSPDGLSFVKPAVLSFRYGTDVLPVDGIDGIAVETLTAAGWAGLGGGKIDVSSRSLMVRIQTTSPSAGASATVARRPATGTGKSLFGTGPALGVARNKYVPTSGKMDLTAVFRYPPSSTADEFILQLRAALGVIVTWDRPSLGSFSSLSGAAIKYTAPDHLPDVTSVVKSRVHVLDTGSGHSSHTYFEFNVIRRNFLFDAYYIMNIPCGGMNDVSLYLKPPVGTFNYFHFDDDLSFNAGPNVFIGDPDTPTITSCPGKCHDAHFTGVPGQLELQDLKADFRGPQGFFILGGNFQKNAIPPYEQQGDPLFCTGGGGVNLDIPVILGPGDSVYWPVSNETQHSESEGGAIVLVWEFRSIDGDIPPEGK
ncbi:MAG: hypothetical protein ACHQM4_07550 [Thermoanaerobaculia bacterium]